MAGREIAKTNANKFLEGEEQAVPLPTVGSKRGAGHRLQSCHTSGEREEEARHDDP